MSYHTEWSHDPFEEQEDDGLNTSIQYHPDILVENYFKELNEETLFTPHRDDHRHRTMSPDNFVGTPETANCSNSSLLRVNRTIL